MNAGDGGEDKEWREVPRNAIKRLAQTCNAESKNKSKEATSVKSQFPEMVRGRTTN